MKNKKLIGLTALCCTSMLLFACNNNNKKPTPHGPTLYTVTFYSEGEIFDIRQAEAGDVVTPPANDPIKLDHEFIGWYTSEGDLGEKWIFETDVVEEDMSLYARFQENQIDYTVRFLLDGEVAETRTTNSRDQNDITVPQIAVGEGKSLLGFGIAAGTGAGAVDYRVGATFSYNQAVILADDNNVVDLHAIVKTGDIVRLNVGLWTRYADEACMNRVLTAFKSYADDHSVAYDFLDYHAYAPAQSNGDTYFSVDDLAPAVAADESINVVFPSGSNFNTKYAGVAGGKEVKQHESLGVQIKNAKGTATSDGNRYVTRINDDAIASAFVTWLLSDDGKVVLDPEYTPTPVAQLVLTISYYGRYISLDNAELITAEIKRYFTASSITYTNVLTDYVSEEDGPDNDTYAEHILSTSDMSIGGGKASSLNTAFTNNGFTVADKKEIGTIAGETARYYHTFNMGELTVACAAYLLSEAGQAFLATLEA